MRIPVRKCLLTLKISLVFILVITVLGLFEFWRGGRRKVGAFAVYGADSPESEYERLIAEDEARIVPGLGEGGVPAYLVGEEKILGEESLKKLAINVYLSDRISYNRTLRDVRNDACERVMYSAELPSVSVVIIFHNEPYSVVLRTVWSVLNSARRTHQWYNNANYIDNNGAHMNLGYKGQDPSDPFLYLKEIILVDDNSTLPELKEKLSHYINTRMPNFIKILRLPERRGLMAARIAGAHAARGSVLVFLDAHCEVQADWLRPLLQRVKEKRDAVVSPVIDVINQETFELDAADYFQIGGFTFDGHFNWIDIPSWEKVRRGTDISPTWSPTMAGGLFAVDRAYFWSIGGYDEQMSGWGGENLEMSFRIWQCGGTVEIMPCSRVGHVFRAFHPYSAGADSHGVNTARAAAVWMDDYAELYYLYRPDLRENPIIGDLTHRKILREKLKCKSFDWYLQNIYREKYVPLRDSVAFGRFRNPVTGLCLDSLQSTTSPAVLGLYPCHATLQPSQQYSLSHGGQLRDEQLCVTVPNSREDKVRRIVRTPCHEGAKSQEWRILESGQIRHEYTGLCLRAESRAASRPGLAPCERDERQAWVQDLRVTPDGQLYYDSNIISASQMQNLKHLPKFSRLSRSLQQRSFDDVTTEEVTASEEVTTTPLPPDTTTDADRSWQRIPVSNYPETSSTVSIPDDATEALRNRRRTRNNFLLKVLRTLSNGNEQHLEMSIFCKHQKLFPNNSFVRDLVTMFNKYNITVINKGRIFERNRVVALAGKDKERKKKRTRFQKVNFTQDYKKAEADSPQMKVINIATEEVTEQPTEKPRKKIKKVKKKKKVNKIKSKSKKKHTLQPVISSTEVESTTPDMEWHTDSNSHERAEVDFIKDKDRAVWSKARSTSLPFIQKLHTPKDRSLLKRTRTRTNTHRNDLEDPEANSREQMKQALFRARKGNGDKADNLENDVNESGDAKMSNVARSAVTDASKMDNYYQDKSIYFVENDQRRAMKADTLISGGKISMPRRDLQETPPDTPVYLNNKSNSTTTLEPPELRGPTELREPPELRDRQELRGPQELRHQRELRDQQELGEQHELREPPSLQRAYEELKNYEDPPRRKLAKKLKKAFLAKNEQELQGTDVGDTALINMNGSKASVDPLDEDAANTDEVDERFMKDVKIVLRAPKSMNDRALKVYKVSMQNEDDESDDEAEED